MHASPSIRREALQLVSSGRSLNSVSKQIGVSRAAIRAWLSRPDSLRPPPGAECPAPCTSTPAYAALFGFYLGDGCISRLARTCSLRAAFLRGLFHSDGCRVDNWATGMVAGQRKRYEYGRWQFVNESAEIMAWCGGALDLLKVPWRQTNRRTLSVSRREGVALLDELIGAKS